MKVLMAALLAMSLISVTHAQNTLLPRGGESDLGPELVQTPDDAVSLQQAIAIASERVAGRVVRADTVVREGRRVHEIRIINDDNLVRTILVDAQSGSVL